MFVSCLLSQTSSEVLQPARRNMKKKKVPSSSLMTEDEHCKLSPCPSIPVYLRFQADFKPNNMSLK